MLYPLSYEGWDKKSPGQSLYAQPGFRAPL